MGPRRIDTWAKSGHGEKKLLIVHHVLSVLVWPLASLHRVAGVLLHFQYTELWSPFLQLRWVTLFFWAEVQAGQVYERALCFELLHSRGEKYESCSTSGGRRCIRNCHCTFV